MKVTVTKSEMGTMLVEYFYSRSLIHYEFAPFDKTVTESFDTEILDGFWKELIESGGTRNKS